MSRKKKNVMKILASSFVFVRTPMDLFTFCLTQIKICITETGWGWILRLRTMWRDKISVISWHFASQCDRFVLLWSISLWWYCSVNLLNYSAEIFWRYAWLNGCQQTKLFGTRSHLAIIVLLLQSLKTGTESKQCRTAFSADNNGRTGKKKQL